MCHKYALNLHVDYKLTVIVPCPDIHSYKIFWSEILMISYIIFFLISFLIFLLTKK